MRNQPQKVKQLAYDHTEYKHLGTGLIAVFVIPKSKLHTVTYSELSGGET